MLMFGQIKFKGTSLRFGASYRGIWLIVMGLIHSNASIVMHHALPSYLFITVWLVKGMSVDRKRGGGGAGVWS